MTWLRSSHCGVFSVALFLQQYVCLFWGCRPPPCALFFSRRELSPYHSLISWYLYLHYTSRYDGIGKQVTFQPQDSHGTRGGGGGGGAEMSEDRGMYFFGVTNVLHAVDPAAPRHPPSIQ